MQFRQVAWITVSSIIAVVVTVGLLWPWARIRWARYRLQNLSLECSTSLDNFIAKEQKQVSAIGEEIIDMFDIDIAL